MINKMPYNNTLLLILSFFFTQCSSVIIHDKEHYIDLFCSLEISYYDSLFTDIDYVTFRSTNFNGNRNSFIIDFSNKERIIVIKDGSNFFYREVLFEFDSPRGTLSSPYLLRGFDWRYPVSPERIICIINLCLDNDIYDVFVCREEKRYFFKTHLGTIYYTTNYFYNKNAENICGKWYLINLDKECVD